MTEALDSYLVEKYPKIFKNRYSDMKNTAMCWGFEHNDGWFWLIDQLCNSIQKYIDNNNTYRGDDKKIPQVVATQVKEKYGSLCFYYSGGDSEIDGMVRFAETMSSNICERCGTTEDVGSTTGWIYVICKDCYEKSTPETSNLIWTPNKCGTSSDLIKDIRKIKLDKLNK